jgi:thiol:disulfide interchange protein
MRFKSFNWSGTDSLKAGLGIALAAIALTVSFWLASPSLAADTKLNWNTDVNAGLEEGKRSHKYVLADVYTEWCGWCKKLDRETFSNEGMVKFLNAKFVCVKANAEDNGAGQKLAGQYRVSGYPCALVFDQDGKFIGKVSGYRDAKGYQDALDQLISNPPANPLADK